MKRQMIVAVCTLAGLCAFGESSSYAVILTPTSTTRLFSYVDSQQGDPYGGTVYTDDDSMEWNVAIDPLSTPTTTAEADPLPPPGDGSGFSSFATAGSDMVDAGGWTTTDNADSYSLTVSNQGTQSPGGVGPDGWGYSVAYVLATYDTTPSVGESLGEGMTVQLDISFAAGDLYAEQGTDEYFLDLGYALGTGLTDYDPVLADPANNPNPGLAQFDAYQSWGSNGFSSIQALAVNDTLIYSGVIGDQVQVLLALDSFSYSQWGYTWTDGQLDATITASVIPEPSTLALLLVGGLALLRRRK